LGRHRKRAYVVMLATQRALELLFNLAPRLL
jgi:hypothetical protein